MLSRLAAPIIFTSHLSYSWPHPQNWITVHEYTHVACTHSVYCVHFNTCTAAGNQEPGLNYEPPSTVIETAKKATLNYNRALVVRIIDTAVVRIIDIVILCCAVWFYYADFTEILLITKLIASSISHSYKLQSHSLSQHISLQSTFTFFVVSISDRWIISSGISCYQRRLAYSILTYRGER